MKQPRRRRRSPTLGKVQVSWRWEVGAPLVLMGALIAYIALSADGAGVIFWVGAGFIAVGAAAMSRPA